MRFDDLVSSVDEPSSQTPAKRTPISTRRRSEDHMSMTPTLGSDLRNAGFVTGLLHRRRRKTVHTTRRNFIRGSMISAAAGVAAGAAKFGPARAAGITPTLTNTSGMRVWAACPADNSNDDCLPGCGPLATCTACCTADGFFRNEPSAGYITLPGLCTPDGGVGGWLWAYGAPCGACATVELRCTDGAILVAGSDGQLFYQPHICRHVVQCNGAPTVPDAGYVFIGAVASAVDNRNGSFNLSGWIAASGSTQCSYRITVDNALVATGFANQFFAADHPGVGPNHGFSLTVTGVPPGDHEVCVWGVTSLEQQVACLELTTAGVPTTPPDNIKNSTEIPLYLGASGVLEVLRLDGLGDAFTSGWACLCDTGEPLIVEAVINGIAVATTTTSGARADVSAYNPQFAAATGFTLDIPLMPNVISEVCIEVVDPATGRRMPLGCQELVGS